MLADEASGKIADGGGRDLNVLLVLALRFFFLWKEQELGLYRRDQRQNKTSRRGATVGPRIHC